MPVRNARDGPADLDRGVTTVSMRGYEMGANAIPPPLSEIAQGFVTNVHQRVALELHLIVRRSTVGFVGRSRRTESVSG